MNLRKFFITLTLAGMAVLMCGTDAHAYIDPSTGSYILQILLAGLLGAMFTLKIFWKNVKAYFTRLFSGASKTDDSGQ